MNHSISGATAFADEIAEPPKGLETILVVEDESPVLNFVAAILRHHGYRVLTATHGFDALLQIKAQEGKIDLLLSDVMMKWKNGLQTADEAHALMPGLKILFISGYTEGEIVHQAMEREAATFLAKPFTIDTLVSKVREVLDQ